MDQPKAKMPPLGVTPKWRWDELVAEAMHTMKEQRILDLCSVLNRYIAAGEPALQEWVDELKELCPGIRLDYIKTCERKPL
jgi:hypothetical protein